MVKQYSMTAGDVEKQRLSVEASSDGSKQGEPPHHENAIGDQAESSSVAASSRIATPEEEARIVRKLDRRLLPLVFVLYSLAVLDRSNLGNAKLAGLEEDIDISGVRYNWLGTIFYIAYISFQWTTIGWKAFPPHIYASLVVFFWGFVATIQATCKSWSTLMVCRFFLGVSEAMFGPGVPLYLTFFYPRDKVGFRHGVFLSGAAAANAYGGALAYGISQAKSRISVWQILFIIEGLPTCVLAIFVFFLLPDSIEKTKFLTDDEKAIAKSFVARNQSADSGKGKSRLSFADCLDAFKDPKSFIPAIMYFSCNVSFASLPLFLPTIISELGAFDRIEANGLSAPPYVLCVLMVWLFCYLSDRFTMRGPFCFTAAMLAAIGFIIQATTTAVAPRYFGMFLSVQIFVCVAIILAWTANLSSNESRRAGGYVILSTIGQCGPLLGTNVFPASEAPLYRKGLWISAAFCLLVAVCSVLLSAILIWENKKIDREPENADGKRKVRRIW